MIAITSVVLLALVSVYLGFRLLHGFRVYLKLRGSRLLTCPETNKVELVQLAAGAMATEATLREPYFRVKKCSRWPLRQDCGQDCLSQIEVHPSDLRISRAWRVT
jgi:hypothetical protein